MDLNIKSTHKGELTITSYSFQLIYPYIVDIVDIMNIDVHNL